MAISDVLRVQGDYIVQAHNGNITLDTGISTGTVIITGNLDVKGTTTTIESTNATIKDNIITLNSGETGSDIVTLGSSGIWVDRGNNAGINYRASLTFVDASPWSPTGASDKKGYWDVRVANNQGGAVKLNAILLSDDAPTLGANLGPSLNFFGGKTARGVLSVYGTTNYEDYCGLNKDNIPNVQYVLNQIALGAQTPPNIRKLTQLNSSVLLTDNGVDAPNVTINLGGPNIQYTFKSDGELRIDGLNASMSVLDNSVTAIATTASSAPLVLAATNAGIELKNYLVMTDATQSAANWTSAKNALGVGDTIVYSSATTAVTGGGTNLFFVNSNNKIDPTTNTVIPEELVSRRKALVYAIVF